MGVKWWFLAKAAARALSFGVAACGSANSGQLAVGLVNSDAGNCISTNETSIVSSPGVVCLVNRIAPKGTCVSISVSTPSKTANPPYLFRGSLKMTFPVNVCTAASVPTTDR